MLSPDTLVVFTHSAAPKDYTPILSSLLASILVAGMAWYSTKAQRRIAEAGMATQRDLAKQGIEGQLEIAKRGRIVESRREWMRELRQAVASFEAAAFGIADRAQEGQTATATDEIALAHRTDMMRHITAIVLLLDETKPDHREINVGLNAVAGWSLSGGLQLPYPSPSDDITLRSARKFPDANAAITSLDRSVRRALEAAWQKIRLGE